jgi:hypothetical protein
MLGNWPSWDSEESNERYRKTLAGGPGMTVQGGVQGSLTHGHTMRETWRRTQTQAGMSPAHLPDSSSHSLGPLPLQSFLAPRSNRPFLLSFPVTSSKRPQLWGRGPEDPWIPKERGQKRVCRQGIGLLE